MKKFVILLSCLISSHLLVGQNNTASENNTKFSSQTAEVTTRNYLLLTEKELGGSFTLHQGELLCIRLEDKEVCSTPTQVNGPFAKTVSNYFFMGASSEEYLSLKEEMLSLSLEENEPSSTSSASIHPFFLKQKPCDKKQEHEWIFETLAPGQTTLTFYYTQHEVGCNGAPTPMYIVQEPVTFTITVLPEK